MKEAATNLNYKVGRVLIVDDEAELMTALCEKLAEQGYETAGFTSGAEALEALREHDYDLLLTDLMMPGMDGIELIRAGLEIDPNLVGIIMTGQGTVQTAVEAMKIGAFDYILKPFKLNSLLPTLSRAMEVHHLRMDVMQLRETVAIHELGKAIAFSSDLSSILNKVADAALQQCDADEVSIMLPTRDGNELYVAVAHGGHTEHIGARVPMEQGIAGWVARNRETVMLRGEVNDQRFSPINPRADIRVALSVPMLSGGNLVGVLNINVIRSHRHLTLGQVKALSVLVSIIAPILENTWLNIQIRQAEEKYHSIFENAIEGIYQTTPEGQFITANTAMAAMLGYDTPEEFISAMTDIANQLYVNPEERTKLKQMIENNGQVKSFETRFYRKDGRTIWVSISIHAVCDKKGELLNYDGIAEDISERKRAEQQQILINKILEALNRPNEIINLIRDILLLLKEHTSIEAIGIRLREGEDFPYFETNGFPPHFLEAENHLCARDNTGEIIRDSNGNPCLECMCGNIVCGRTDPTFPFFTEGGSFWTNSTTELLASTSEEDRQACTRNRCNSEGYESVALIPLRSGDEIIGLLQLNDSRRDSFSIEMIQFLEGTGITIGIAVARKRAVEVLSIKTMLLEAQSETAIDGILAVDNEGRSLLFNKRFGELWKIPRHIMDAKDDAKMLEYVLKQLKDPEEFGRKVAYLYEHRTEKSREEIEFADGRYLDRYSSPLLSTDGQYLGRIWFFRDITDQKRAEEWLLRERSMLDRIMKTSPAGIMVVDRKRQIVFTNKRAEDIFCLTKNEITQRGYSASEWHITDFDGNPLPEEQLPFTQVMNTGNPVYGIRHAVALSDGRRVFLSINGAPVSDEQGNISEVVLTIDDITDRIRMEEERQKLEERLRMSQRLEAIGTLAGGIAHDFNNILSAVMGFAEMALDETAGDTPSHQYLSEILHAGRRARDLVRQILTFSRQAEYEKNPIQVNPIVKETIKFLRASIPVSIDIQQKIESDSMVPADPTQLHQIIMNLCTNAAHAMEKGGTLEVSLSDVEMDEDAASIYPGMVPGRYLRLRVSDTGCGMTPEVMERIFEPFFTTKPRGEGTGMGLAVVHGIVKEYAGAISVHSELGKGSAFHVYLPVIEAMEDAAGELSEALLTGTERILFVDDEELLVKLGKKMLERLGYQVTTQTSPLVALDLFRNKPDAFDLVITDVTMPKMTGDELAKELLKIRPDIPVILCTGFSARMSDEKARELGIKAFIMKPTLIQEIARTIRKVLGE